MFISFRDCVDPRVIVRPGELCQRKISVNTSRIEPNTLKSCSAVPQHLLIKFQKYQYSKWRNVSSTLSKYDTGPFLISCPLMWQCESQSRSTDRMNEKDVTYGGQHMFTVWQMKTSTATLLCAYRSWELAQNCIPERDGSFWNCSF